MILYLSGDGKVVLQESTVLEKQNQTVIALGVRTEFKMSESTPKHGELAGLTGDSSFQFFLASFGT